MEHVSNVISHTQKWVNSYVLLQLRQTLFTLLFTLFFSQLAFGQQANSITWHIVDIPPLSIASDGIKSDAYCNAVTHYVTSKMPNTTHKVIGSSIKRLLHEMENKDNVCSVCLIKNGNRSDIVEFSKATAPPISIGVITLKAHYDKLLPYITENKQLDLLATLKQSELVLGVVDKRSYGTSVEKILSAYKNSNKVTKHSSTISVFPLIQMLLRKRLDMVLAYQLELAHYSTIKDTWQYIPLTKQSSSNFIGCSKTATGKSIIEQVNKIILDNNDDFIHFHKKAFKIKH